MEYELINPEDPWIEGTSEREIFKEDVIKLPLLEGYDLINPEIWYDRKSKIWRFYSDLEKTIIK